MTTSIYYPTALSGISLRRRASSALGSLTVPARGLTALACCAAMMACESASPPLTVTNAAALGPAFRALGDEMVRSRAIPAFAQENAPSLEVIRSMTELGKVPDVLAVADVRLLDSLVVPKFSRWYLIFASNAMVLAYGEHSRHQAEIGREPWYLLLQRADIRVGRSDPRVDPSGYRALLSIQLAERHYRVPGLAGALLKAMPDRDMRRAEADLSALVESGELDYIWTYRNLARAHGLRWIELPPEVNLESPDLAAWYDSASVRVETSRGTLVVRGAPILFGLTIPRRAPSPALGNAFVLALLSKAGIEAAAKGGLTVLRMPLLIGDSIPAAIASAVRTR